jgi:type I restriction enzyme S subunit
MKWATPELDKVVSIRKGTVNPLSNPETEYELFSIPGYDKGQPEIKTGYDILSNKTIVRPGDVLFSKLNPRIPRIWIVPQNMGHQQISSTEFWPLVCRADLLYNGYLSYFLQKITRDGVFTDSIEAATKSRSRIKPFHLLRHRIPLPPLSEQPNLYPQVEAN